MIVKNFYENEHTLLVLKVLLALAAVSFLFKQWWTAMIPIIILILIDAFKVFFAEQKIIKKKEKHAKGIKKLMDWNGKNKEVN